jgi:cell division protein ZapD
VTEVFPVVLFEFPLNESVRTMLRLEYLFDRLGQLLVRDAPVDHHFALVTLFEILDIASRADLKGDLVRELDQQRARLATLQGRAGVSESMLGDALLQLEQAHRSLSTLPGRIGAKLTANDWLMSVRSRIGIPGGTCEFDLPGYYAWQKLDAAHRRADLLRWAEPLMPVAQALSVLLALLRESGVAQMIAVVAGQFQQGLPAGRTYQLLRLRVADAREHVPEISGHRLMVSIRLMRPDEDGRLRPCNDDAALEMTLCA